MAEQIDDILRGPPQSAWSCLGVKPEDCNSASPDEANAIEAILMASRHIRDENGRLIMTLLPPSFALAVLRIIRDHSAAPQAAVLAQIAKESVDG